MTSSNGDMVDLNSTRSVTSGDLEKTLTSLPKHAKAVLQVLDAPYDGSRPVARAEWRLDALDDIEAGLARLPLHESGCARILNVTVHSDFVITGQRETKGPKATQQTRDVLLRWLERNYTQTNIGVGPLDERRIFRWLSDPLLVNDIGSISAQWNQRLDGEGVSLYRLVNRTSLQQHPLDWDVKPRDSFLTCAQVGDDRLIAIVVNDVWSHQVFQVNKSGKEQIDFLNPRFVVNMEAGTSLTALSDGNLDTFAKLLVLDFFLDSVYMQRVDYYGPLIYPVLSDDNVVKFSLTKNPHLQVPLGLFEPRIKAKGREAFKEIQDAEGILRSINNLIDSIEYVLYSLQPKTLRDLKQASARGSNVLRLQVDDLVQLCKERRENCKRAVEALERQLDYLTKRHTIGEAKSIRTLTILASLYLPLSLAASALGMQTPFKRIAHSWHEADGTNAYRENTNLIFDFLGISISLGAVTIFIVYGIKLVLWLRSNGLGYLSKHFKGPYSILYYGRRWRFGGRGGMVFDLIRSAIALLLSAVMAAAFTTIFVVGMLDDAQGAWDIAWKMFAVWGGISVFLISTYVFLYWKLHRKRLRA